jgi:MOSC domain-containing protein YiiM
VPEGAVGRVKSVNIGQLAANPAKRNQTAIDKRPAVGPVWVSDPGPEKGSSGLAGDHIGDAKNHGGGGQAVYVFAREDLDRWESELGRPLPDGAFGENLTTLGLDPNGALVGERWQVGRQLVLQVTGPRIPCATFAAKMAIQGWARRFTGSGRPGAYLRVIVPGPVSADDAVIVVHKPTHKVDVTTVLFALTIKPQLIGDLLSAGDALPDELRKEVEEDLRKTGRAVWQ